MAVLLIVLSRFTGLDLPRVVRAAQRAYMRARSNSYNGLNKVVNKTLQHRILCSKPTLVSYVPRFKKHGLEHAFI